MNFELELGRIKSLFANNALPFLVGGIGLILIFIGIASAFLSNQKEEILFEENVVTESENSTSEIFVDVSGAVVKSSVYRLAQGARLQDALIAAGGLSELADREWVAKKVNLAAKLKDGTKIYIPEKGQNRQPSGDGQMIGGSDSYMININTASQTELDKLPGIGPVTAQKIIDNRPYTDVGELLSKKIVGQKVFEQIKQQISVY